MGNESMVEKFLWVSKTTTESGWPYVVLTAEEAAKLAVEINQLKESKQ